MKNASAEKIRLGVLESGFSKSGFSSLGSPTSLSLSPPSYWLVLDAPGKPDQLLSL
ncbi:hypothetical protein [Hymenobacter canadensis]|uniref:Uncharacterized protein n=1 Tax=Hymenobacter canadensis TaxID=2999067 RepID=A0ABY7LVI9_9BACT|nr:hypothetical protein [Hymenobacter canadensis]WBA44066.1 hypothetical protein O3303_19435 [Hymenobacter canadensis]